MIVYEVFQYKDDDRTTGYIITAIDEGERLEPVECTKEQALLHLIEFRREFPNGRVEFTATPIDRKDLEGLASAFRKGWTTLNEPGPKSYATKPTSVRIPK